MSEPSIGATVPESQVDPTGGGPRGYGAHAVLGQRAGLVGADHVGGAERLDRRSRLTSAPRPASSRTATASARVITGSSPSGTLPASSPTANTNELISDRSAGQGGERDERQVPASPIPRRSARPPGGPGARAGWDPALTRSERAAIRPTRCPCRWRTRPPALPAGAVGAAEHQLMCVQHGHIHVDHRRRTQRRAPTPRSAPTCRPRSPRLSSRTSAAMRSPSSITTMSPGTSCGRIDLDDGAVALDLGPLRQVFGQLLDRPLGLQLLHERERGVEHDDQHYRGGNHV